MKKTIIVWLILIGLFLISGCYQNTAKETQQVGIGDVTILHGDSGGVPVYRTFEAYKKSSDAAVSGDYAYTHKELIRFGDKFYVKSGTKARILDIKIFHEIYQLRILDGSKEGVKGWVSQSYVK